MRNTVDNVNHLGSTGDRDVLDQVHAVMHLFRSRQFQALRDGPHGVTHMDSRVLGFFARHPGSTQSALAQHSGRDKAQLARLVSGLRERGLLAAETDVGDRRNLRLSLTPDGLAVQRSLQQQARRLSARALAGFDADEKARLLALLQRVKENLDPGDGPATGS